ncbi:MAG: hypothetical protein FWE50_00330 [Alphaproteobacteria bacterium]|nr:hypothetical protein [Alphaproteobacteria bacterium]
MANLHFHYGTMGVSKSASLITDAHNFRQNAIGVECIKPVVKGVPNDNKIISRLGIEIPALSLVSFEGYSPQSDTRVILVNEVHFFAPSDIDHLVYIADNFEILVMCYGLMADSNGRLFPGAQRLVEVAAKLRPMESTCQIKGCMRKADHHLRYDENGEVVIDGPQLSLGNDHYKSVCRRHFSRYYKKA